MNCTTAPETPTIGDRLSRPPTPLLRRLGLESIGLDGSRHYRLIVQPQWSDRRNAIPLSGCLSEARLIQVGGLHTAAALDSGVPSSAVWHEAKSIRLWFILQGVLAEARDRGLHLDVATELEAAA